MRYFFILLVGLFCLASCEAQSTGADRQIDINTESESVLRKKAVAGVAHAQYILGAKYALGKGVTQDNGEAVKWFRKAAEQGHANAQNNLGVRYAKGEGVPEDLLEAYALVNIAAAQGKKEAIESRNLLKKNMDSASLSKAQERSREYFKKYVLPFQ